ncbi:4Fe-4S binding protein [Desulforamulus aeronauticus]|uniref:4Fe-4S dicluster domain-containing protein n=1 Tax=Desulforamulus aeronauticus DSM 10349 TaxID=1121421 RepID=A0A1M6NH26_9FIRM|nr:4Fe-4S binding protein [Desulforamulus aeronauticus]SHJ94999.1 4Fe-4S dicluster domain-containing protein [Desulforamulus aeronauticus DSM 10349]
MSIKVDAEKCIGCGTCEDICPLDCIRMDEAGKPFIKYELCWYCGSCQIDCPCEAIKVTIPFLIR